MAKSFLNKQDRLLLIDADKKAKYSSIVMEVNPPVLVITEPVSTSEGPLTLQKGEQREFELMCGDAIYTFTTDVLERIAVNPPLYRMAYPRAARRRQRRQFFRLEVFLDVEYEIVKEGEEEESRQDHETSRGVCLAEEVILIPEDSDLHTSVNDFEKRNKEWRDHEKKIAFTVDISGGGIQLVTSQYIKANSELMMRIKLPDVKGGVMVRGRVIRCFSIQVGSWKKYRAAVEFMDIDEKSRDHIIKFIFDKSRKRMQT